MCDFGHAVRLYVDLRSTGGTERSGEKEGKKRRHEREGRRKKERERDRYIYTEAGEKHGETERIAFTQRSFRLSPADDRESPSTRLDSNSLVATTVRQTEERRRRADTFERKDEKTA